MESLRIPTSLVNRTDVLRLLREINWLNDFFVGAAARQTGSPMQVPKTSRVLDQLAEINEVNLVDPGVRKRIVAELDKLLKTAPSVHISFASEPSPKTLEPILVWMRSNVHPQVLLQVGLQPAIAAGCVVRTPNRVFDFSLRSHLDKQAQYLTTLVTGSIDGR